MMATPFDRTARAIPVTVVTGSDTGALPLDRLADSTPVDEVAVVRPPQAAHDHADGTECIACDARGDVRAVLFELLQEQRLGRRPAFSSVVLDLRGWGNPQRSIDRLIPGRQPAMAMRDHTVAKSFHLLKVVELAV